MVLNKLRGRRLYSSGFTLVEVVIALLFGLIMISGTLSFSYYSRLHAHKANIQNAAARLSSAVLESWKANGGRDSYDPVQTLGADFDVSSSDLGTAGFDDVVGRYRIVLDDITYYATLSYKNAASGAPKMLNVAVAWTEDRSALQDGSYHKLVQQTAYMQN